MEIYCTQKTDGKRTTILKESKENEEMRSRMNFNYLLFFFIYCITVFETCFYHLSYFLGTQRIADLISLISSLLCLLFYIKTVKLPVFFTFFWVIFKISQNPGFYGFFCLNCLISGFSRLSSNLVCCTR